MAPDVISSGGAPRSFTRPRALAVFKVKLEIIKGRDFSPFRGTYIHVLLQNIYRMIMSYHSMLSGTRLVLSYKTQRWNVYVAGILLKIKYGNNETAFENDKTSSIVSKT